MLNSTLGLLTLVKPPPPSGSLRHVWFTSRSPIQSFREPFWSAVEVAQGTGKSSATLRPSLCQCLALGFGVSGLLFLCC